MSLAPLLVSAADESHGGINHWIIAGIVFLIFVVLVVGLLAFGAGRDHS